MFGSGEYKAHEKLVAPARGTAQLWRLAVGVILIAGVALLASQFLSQTLSTFLGARAYTALTGGDGRATQLSVLFLLYSFLLLVLGVAVALRVAHNRGFLEVFGDRRSFVGQFWNVLTILVLLHVALAILPPWSMAFELERNVTLGAWLLVLPFAILAILVQVGAEELLFRGYLQQQIAARFSSPLVWMLVPSVLFGWGHYAPAAAGDQAVYLALWATVFGMAMADLTARAGTLGPAIAVHFVNNALAILFVSLPDGLSGLSMYTLPFDLEDSAAVGALLPVEFMMILVYWLSARLAIRR